MEVGAVKQINRQNQAELIINIEFKCCGTLMGFKTSCPPDIHYLSSSQAMWVSL